MINDTEFLNNIFKMQLVITSLLNNNQNNFANALHEPPSKNNWTTCIIYTNSLLDKQEQDVILNFIDELILANSLIMLNEIVS